MSSAEARPLAPRHALLLNPRQSDAARRSSTKCLDETARIMGCSAASPPLGLLTVAALLPAGWPITVVDQNVREPSESEWEEAEIVMISGFVDQAEAQQALIVEAKRRGKLVVVGGGVASAMPEIVRAQGADFVVVDEAELGLPILYRQLADGSAGGIIRPEGSADVTLSPVPRFDLLDMSRYVMATVQFSRGCPFRCEFCDVIEKGIGGKTLRAKSNDQFVAELEALFRSGWRGAVFIADDNFIGDRRAARRVLPAVAEWMDRRGRPFTLMTEATINLALDTGLTGAMVEAGITRLFVGIESVDREAIQSARKRQNLGLPADEACRRLARAGIEVHAALILGFDGETSGTGQRLLEFLEAAPVANADFNFLYALPQAALAARMQREDRLLPPDMPPQPGPNFVTVRPRAEILNDALIFFAGAYDPVRLLDRCWRQHRDLALTRARRQSRPSAAEWRGFLSVAWRYAVKRRRAAAFLHHAFDLGWRRLDLLWSFLRALAQGETHIRIDRQLTPSWRQVLDVAAGIKPI